MNREILFRGKRTGNGEWVEGKLFNDGIVDSNRLFVGDIVIERNKEGGEEDWNWDVTGIDFYEVDPETVCQYTGLTDKNGKKIFEGDIVKHFNRPGDNDTYVISHIEWYQDGCRFIKKNMNQSQYNITGECIYEVIGNIFDNPELLEGGAE